MRKIEQGIEVMCRECSKIVKLACWRKEVQEKKDTNQYLCKSCVQKGDRARGFAKAMNRDEWWTAERKEETSLRVSGEGNPMFGKSWKDYTDEDTIARHARLSGHLGELNGMFGKSIFEYMDEATTETWKRKQQVLHEQRLKTGKYVDMGLASAKKPIKMTKPERIVREWLETNRILNQYGYRLENSSYDFRVGDTLIEVHGDYWHGNPEIYGPEKRLLNETQLFKIDRDKEKERLAREYNFSLIVIWESEIKRCDFSKLETLKGDTDETCKS
jgi:G:T-mismatch repair DNA endonuclease (very short patch repair protein)